MSRILKKENINLIINHLPVISCLLLLASCIVYINKFRDLWYVVPVAFLMEYIHNKRWTDFVWNTKRLYYVIVLLFFTLFFTYIPFEDTFEYREMLLRNRIPLLGLGVVGFLGLNKYHKLSYYLHTLLITSLVTIGFLVLVKIGFLNFISSENKTLLFTTARIEFVNSHMMFNLYLNITLVAIWYLLSNQYKKLSVIQKTVYVISYALIFFILLISEGRSGLLISLFITGSILFLEVYKRNKIWILGLTGLFAIFIIFRLTYHPRISSEKVSQEPRLFLWENAFSLIKEKPIIGWGANDAQHQFAKQIWLDTTGFVQTFWHPSDFVDSHNQFIQSYLEFGVIGFVLLLVIYLSPYFLTDTYRKIFCLLLLIISVFQSMFDMFVTGQFASIFMLISFMVLWTSDDVKPTNDLSTP